MCSTSTASATSTRLDYLLEEVRVLREVYTAATGQKRFPFTDEQRRRLAAALQRQPALEAVGGPVAPRTGRTARPFEHQAGSVP